MSSTALTEARLDAALNRLLNGVPERVKRGGKLTLNKINNEAGLSHSYVHKFSDFVNRANPQIEKYNLSAHEIETGMAPDDSTQLDEVSRLKLQLKKEKRLKEQYRTERDNTVVIQKELEQLNSTLMFRVYELQEEARHFSVIQMERPNS